jgi:hypothetical protein
MTHTEVPKVILAGADRFGIGASAKSTNGADDLGVRRQRDNNLGALGHTPRFHLDGDHECTPAPTVRPGGLHTSGPQA